MNSPTLLQIVIFIIGTIIIIFVSKRSLANIKVHGFYRFFVFEFILILILLNFEYWFVNPLSLQQIISWLLLLISLFMLYQSVYLFRKLGNSGRRQNDSTNFEFENTSTLIKESIYKYIRHPMYSSLLFLCLGAFCKHISVLSTFLAILIILFLILTAKMEEKENVQFFGSSYSDYIKETKMFIPYLF